jgi:hypothetical protein
VAKQSVSQVVRGILSADLSLPADDVIKAAQRQGLRAPVPTIRAAVHNVRSELRKAAGKPLPAAARETAKPTPAPSPAAGSADLASVLANVALVDRVAGACGGADNARQVAEAVRACGGVDQFLMHLDTVVGIRGG